VGGQDGRVLFDLGTDSWRGLFFTPKAFYSNAQRRAAHGWVGGRGVTPTPKALYKRTSAPWAIDLAGLTPVFTRFLGTGTKPATSERPPFSPPQGDEV